MKNQLVSLRKLSFVASLAVATLATGINSHAAVLTGSVSSASGNVNLTTDGTLGWVKYGFSTVPYFEQKSGFSAFDAGIGAFNSGPVGGLTFTWTNGGAFQPTGTNVNMAYYTNNFSFNLTTTSVSPQVLNFYFYGAGSTNTFTATLGSETYTAPNFTSGNVNFALNFTPDSVGQVLNLSVTGSGDRAAYGASLAVIPEPSTWALMAASLTMLVVFRRRRVNAC
ncbi:MAG: PEP-CTERM sorting domain-containing protein [Terrimicrobiaceae bacterium]